MAVTANTGSNSWNTNGAWVGGVQPTAADDVIIPATAVVTIPTATTVLGRSLTVQASATLAFASTTAILNLGDGTAGLANVALSISGTATITLTGIGVINFISTSATVQTITTGGKTLPTWTINGVGNNYQLTDAFSTGIGTTGTLTNGGFDSNSQTMSIGSFLSTGSTTRTLNITNSSITTNSGSGWQLVTTGLTFTSTNSTITLAAATSTFAGGGATYNNVVLSGSGSVTFGGANTFTNLNRTGTAAKTDGLSLSANQTVTGNLTLTGNSATNRLLVNSSTSAAVRTLTAAAVSLTNVDFTDITGAGAAAPFTGTSLGDALGNSSITFDAPTTQTWSGTSGGNWSANAWTSRVPLPQDTAVISAAFSASQTITLDMPRLGKDIDFTGVSGSPAVSSSLNPTLFGSLTLASGVGSLTGWANTTTIQDRSGITHNLTSAGKTFSCGWVFGVAINGGVSTMNILDTFSSLAAITQNGIILNLSAPVTCTTYAQGTSATKTINFGANNINLTATGAVIIWTALGASNTYTGTGGVVISTTSASTRTLAGGGGSQPNFTYTLAGSTGGLDITGSNTFNDLNFSDVTNARTLRFTAGTTNTFTGNFNVMGTAGKLMTISSITAATHTLSKASGTVSEDYLSITNSIATGVKWYAGANSTDGGGNTGWIFTIPSTGTGGGASAGGIQSHRALQNLINLQ